jgi:hypothetical protein
MENAFDDLFITEDFNRYMRQFVKPIVNNIYNEFYVYIWFICIYNVFLIFFTLANLILLYKLYAKTPNV